MPLAIGSLQIVALGFVIHLICPLYCAHTVDTSFLHFKLFERRVALVGSRGSKDIPVYRIYLFFCIRKRK